MALNYGSCHTRRNRFTRVAFLLSIITKNNIITMTFINIKFYKLISTFILLIGTYHRYTNTHP